MSNSNLSRRLQKVDSNNLFMIGISYYEGNKNLAKNYSKAFKYFKKAAEKGHPKAQYALGILYYDGKGVAKNDTEAFTYFELAAKQGHPKAQFRLAQLYISGKGVAKNDREAFRYFKLAADQGNPDAQFQLAQSYISGEGVAKNDTEAFRYFKLAADQGNPYDQFQLAQLYYNGTGVAKNDTEAFKYFELAANQGHPNAQFRLAQLYISGEGVAKNDTEAFRYFKLAADQGNPDAQFAVGDFYHSGTVVAKDVREALKYYHLAADQDFPDALFELGKLYYSGTGVAKNHGKALEYFQKAADQGHKEAIQRLLAMRGKPILREKTSRYNPVAQQQKVNEQIGEQIEILFGDILKIRANNQAIQSNLTKNAREKAASAASTQRSVSDAIRQIEQIVLHKPEHYEEMLLAAKEIEKKVIQSSKSKQKILKHRIQTPYTLEHLMERANHGNENSQIVLAQLYSSGKGVPQNHVKASQYYNLAAKTRNTKKASHESVSKPNYSNRGGHKSRRARTRNNKKRKTRKH